MAEVVVVGDVNHTRLTVIVITVIKWRDKKLSKLSIGDVI